MKQLSEDTTQEPPRDQALLSEAPQSDRASSDPDTSGEEDDYSIQKPAAIDRRPLVFCDLSKTKTAFKSAILRLFERCWRRFGGKREAKVIPDRSFGAFRRSGATLGGLWGDFGRQCTKKSTLGTLWAPFRDPLGGPRGHLGLIWSASGGILA